MNLPVFNENHKNKETAITIGTFDGVHIGHQKILRRLKDRASELNLTPTVLTLFPHPRMVLEKNSELKLLHTIKERIQFLNNLGIEHVVVKTFTMDFANLSPEDYVKNILVNELNAKHIIIGYDHRFGKKRSANIDDLKQFAQNYGFNVEEISAQDIKHVVVSSTKIRKALNDGDVTLANSFLGYSYFITGDVIKGKKLGRQIGFPTANIDIKEDYKLIPKDGVYIVKSSMDGKLYYGMMNIGTNPTVQTTGRSIEVHFFNFDDNLYSKKLKVEFIKRLRDEEKFKTIDDLKTQLEIDQSNALNYISNL